MSNLIQALKLASSRWRGAHAPANVHRQAARKIYQRAVSRSRHPHFYTQCMVPDNIDGRFDMIAMHLFIVLSRLRKIPQSEPLIQFLMDVFVDDMDRSLREMGVGDLSVGRRVRTMVEALNGRLDAYRTAFGQSADAVSATIARNVYRGVRVQPLAISALISYFYSQCDYLAAQSDSFLLRGEVSFQEPFTQITL